MSTTSSTTGRLSAVKVAGSIAVVGSAVAVAGLGTFGGFTGSTTANADIGTGVVSVDVSAAGSTAPIPVLTHSMNPGDVFSVPLDLRNSGDVDLASMVMTSSAPTSSLLDQDEVHGLQLEVETCAVPWKLSGRAFSCVPGATELYAGPIAAEKSLLGAHSLEAGNTDHLLATVSFPTTGGDELQNQSSGLQFVFTATQRDGGAR